MKKSVFIGISAAVVGIFSSLIFVSADEKTNESEFVKDELIVKFKKESINLSSSAGNVSSLNFSQSLGLDQTDTNEEFNFTVWKNTNSNYTLDELIAALEKSSIVESVQKNYIYRPTVVANDTLFANLWGQNNTGQSVNGTSGTVNKDINAPEAWDIRNQASNIIVAITDTGILPTHEDLKDNLWTNTDETPGNGTDDDNNGYIDDVNGYDFPQNTGTLTDFHGHGTHVSGTIGATGNNNLGVTGVAWNVKLMPLVIFETGSPDPIASTTNIVKGLNYAKDNGAHIINASWGGTDFDNLVKNAIESMPEVLFVAAAGNESTNNDSTHFYPADYDLPNIISVAATDQDDDLAIFSNYGATYVDVAAPGNNIISTTKDGAYGYKNGTSMATPLVSGMAALLLAEKGTLTPAQIKTLLIQTSDSVPGLSGKVVANGRVNLLAALQDLQSSGSGSATIERTDSYTPEANAGTTPNVLEFAVKNNYATSVDVDTINLLGGMDQNENIDVTLTGSGFSFSGNTGTLSGSGNVITLNAGAGFTLSPNETKYVRASATIPNDTALSEFQLKVSDLKLSSGSGVSILSGSELSLSNPLVGANFKISPATFTLSEQFPLNNQDLVAIDTNITGKIAGSFDLTGYSLTTTVTQNGAPFPASNYTKTFDTNTRKFTIDPSVNFTSDATINVALSLIKGSTTITGPTITFTANIVKKSDSDFNSDQEINEDIILPIDFDNQNFTFNNQLILKPSTEIPGLNQGLKIEFDPSTQISKKSGSENTWGGEMQAPKTLSVPAANLFDSASGKSAGVTFVPKKRFEVGSSHVGLVFSRNATFTVPTTETGKQAIYYSQDGNNWFRHGECEVSAGFCVFQANHFTQFALGSESGSSSSVGVGGTSRQNHMRYGGYDPRNLDKQFNPARNEANQIIYRERSKRKRRKYIPCDLEENAELAGSLYNLKLVQGAPSMCREDFGKLKGLPYRSFEK